MTKALEGITVLEVASYVTGPYAGALLGDLGAEVIKIESPPHGDPHRGHGRDEALYHPNFRALNRNKKSVTLNLRDPEGKHILLRLVRKADVLIENFRPGAMDRLGLGYNDLRQLNPRLIYCAISGYGQSGPYRDKPGYDTMGQAFSGMLSLLTDVSDPKPVGVSVSDHVTAVFAAYGILAALMARERTGQGQLVETSLLQATTSFIESYATSYLSDGEVASRESRTRTVPIFCFVASDGLPLVIHLSAPPKFWEGLAKAVGRADLIADPRFKDRRSRWENHAELTRILEQEFRKKPRDYWLKTLEEQDVPSAPIYTIDQVFQDPQVKHLGIPVEVNHPKMGPNRFVGSAVNLSGTPAQMALPAPMVGEHTEEILSRLDCTPEAIKALRAKGVV